MKRKKAILSDSEDEEQLDKAGEAFNTVIGPGLFAAAGAAGGTGAAGDSCPVLSVVKRSRAVSDQENWDSDGGPPRPDSSLAAKLRELGSDSASEDEERPGPAAKKDQKTLFGSDSDSGEDEEE